MNQKKPLIEPPCAGWKQNMRISTTRWIYKRPFLSTTSSIPVNQSQFELDLTLPKLNKSKIGKNNISVMDRWTDGLMNQHMLIDFNLPQLTVIDLNWPALTIFDEITDKKKASYRSTLRWIKKASYGSTLQWIKRGI